MPTAWADNGFEFFVASLGFSWVWVATRLGISRVLFLAPVWICHATGLGQQSLITVLDFPYQWFGHITVLDSLSLVWVSITGFISPSRAYLALGLPISDLAPSRAWFSDRSTACFNYAQSGCPTPVWDYHQFAFPILVWARFVSLPLDWFAII